MFKFIRHLIDGFKASAVQPLIYAMYAGAESWGVYTKRNFAQYSEDAYKRNAVAYSAIQRLARACAYVPLKVRRGEQVLDDHPALALMKRANPWQSGRDFIEAAIAYYLLSGNSYVEGVGPDGSPPLELWALRPDRMRVMPSKMGPAGYLYEVNGTKKTWDCDPVEGKSPILHIKSFNPLDDWYGMSPVEAAAYAIDQHNMAGEWNQALLQNSARPSGALVYNNEAGGTLSEKQFERLKQEINAAYAGTRNAGRIPILEAGLQWQQMSMSPADMDWLNGKNLSSREICLVFGVPPMLLGIPGDNTYSNYQEARQALYEDTALPLLDAFLESINHWLMPAYGEEGVELFACIDQLPALEPKRKERWAAMQNASWLTINEKRQATGFDPVQDKEGDEIFLPSGLMPLKGSTEPPDMNEQGLPGEEKPDEEKPDEEKPDEEKPGEEKPDEEKPDGNGPGGGKKPEKKYIWEDYDEKAWQEQPRDELGRWTDAGATGASVNLAVAQAYRTTQGQTSAPYPKPDPNAKPAQSLEQPAKPKDLGEVKLVTSISASGAYQKNDINIANAYKFTKPSSEQAEEKREVVDFSRAGSGLVRAADAGLNSNEQLQTKAKILNRFLEKNSVTYERTYRGISVSQDVHDSIISSGEISFDAMASSSISPQVAIEFAHSGGGKPVLFEIQGARGAAIQSLSRHPEEKEVLMPKGQRFKIEGIGTTTHSDFGTATVVRLVPIKGAASGKKSLPPGWTTISGWRKDQEFVRVDDDGLVHLV